MTPEPSNPDQLYYKDGLGTHPRSIGMSLLMYARSQIYNLFIREMQPDHTTTILDIGVSDVENEGANFLEKSYPWTENITCAGIGNGIAVKEAYPKVSFVKITPGEKLPFADKRFDIACSNAVLEHVGPGGRADFIKEHLRVAKALFITVPNRWFPVEHHTSLPLLHYSKSTFRTLLAKTKYAEWTKPEVVDFIDKGLIYREWPEPERPKVLYTGVPLGCFSSNICIISRPR